MKQTIVLTLCIIASLGIIRCTKNTTTPTKSTAKCTTCSLTPIEHHTDSTGLFYYLPTAFTPNGDGINDVFRLFYSSQVNIDSSKITIWDMNGNGVFVNNVNQSWTGFDTRGNKCAPGKYPLYLQIRTMAGDEIDVCGCVTILTYKGSCIWTGGNTYYYPDQLDTSGFAFPTNDNICH